MSSIRTLSSTIVRCRRCPRLVAHREAVAKKKRRAYMDHDYWGKPVPGFGDPNARLVLVGLAPGAHGSNRTGRQFTGDASGDFLYPALHAFGYASRPDSTDRGDGLTLTNCYITAAVRCAPPGNKPTSEEREACRPFLVKEFTLLRRAVVYVALGRFAFDALLRTFQDMGITPAGAAPRFAHDQETAFRTQAGRALSVITSYHPSRQNTQTGRLTTPMFRRVFRRAARLTASP